MLGKLQEQLVNNLLTRDYNARRRRIVNASDSQDPQDYTTQKEVKGLIDKLTEQIRTLQKIVGVVGEGEFIPTTLPLELVDEHKGAATSTNSQFIVSSVNRDRNSISLLSYSVGWEVLAFGQNLRKGAWVATDLNSVVMEHLADGLNVRVSDGNTLGAVPVASDIVARFEKNKLFFLNTGPGVNKVATTIADPGVDTSLPTEKAVRAMVNGVTGSVVVNTYSLSGNLTIGYTLNVASTQTLNFTKGVLTSIT
jgi:hypothetical protein